ncbi:MAG: PIN domain-containing protein [Acidimicrobiia bacterium]
MSVTTVAELRYGALVAEWGRHDESGSKLRSHHDRDLGVRELITVVAETRATGRRVAHPIADPAHTNDLWIASTALCIDAPLVSADTIFHDVPGLALHADRSSRRGDVAAQGPLGGRSRVPVPVVPSGMLGVDKGPRSA